MDNLKRLVSGLQSKPNQKPKPIYPKIPKEDREDAELKREFKKQAVSQPEDYEEIQPDLYSEGKTSAFTDDEIRNGYRMSVILGEPLGKRGFRNRR